MKGDAKVVEFLNKALRHELTAVNQYWLHYRLIDNWGYKDLAKQWRKESIEEMEHADKLVERIIFFDGFPNMQVLDPLHIGQNVKEVLDCEDLSREQKIEILRRWEYDVRELQVADEEGMTAPKPPAVTLDIVLDALRELGASADVEHSAPTKQGGS